MMKSTNDLRRRPDGSIDTDFYVAIANRERGRVMLAFLAKAVDRAKSGLRRNVEREAVPHHGIAANR